MSEVKAQFLSALKARFTDVRKLENSRSLFEIRNDAARIYIRYSKMHKDGRTFFGLRKTDLRVLEGHAAFICFLWDDQKEPLLLPYADYEDIFNALQPADDGQYKIQVYCRDATELYIATAGRFNVDANFGWLELERVAEKGRSMDIPNLTHAQVQTLLGAIGLLKGYDLWIPQCDRERLDWSMARRFQCRERVPEGYKKAQEILEQVDVVWIARGGNALRALYEVEHSTTIYSGLLRFNDVRLTSQKIERFAIVANEERRSVFSRQLNRPTFQASGLNETCAFLEYQDVYQWYQRLQGAKGAESVLL